MKSHTSTVVAVAWDPTSSVIIATACTDHKCRVFSAYLKAVDGKEVDTRWGKNPKFGTLFFEVSSLGWVRDVCFDMSGSTLAFCSHNSTVSFIDSERPSLVCLSSRVLPLFTPLSAARGCVCSKAVSAPSPHPWRVCSGLIDVFSDCVLHSPIFGILVLRHVCGLPPIAPGVCACAPPPPLRVLVLSSLLANALSRPVSVLPCLPSLQSVRRSRAHKSSVSPSYRSPRSSSSLTATWSAWATATTPCFLARQVSRTLSDAMCYFLLPILLTFRSPTLDAVPPCHLPSGGSAVLLIQMHKQKHHCSSISLTCRSNPDNEHRRWMGAAGQAHRCERG